jgi:hypothetical protein
MWLVFSTQSSALYVHHFHCVQLIYCHNFSIVAFTSVCLEAPCSCLATILLMMWLIVMFLKLKLPAYTYNHIGLIKYLLHFIYFLLQWPNQTIFCYVQWFDITNWHLTLSILNTIRKGELLNRKQIFQI